MSEAVEHLFADLVDAGLSPYLVGAVVERVKDAPCGVTPSVLCKVVVAVRGRHDIDVDEFCVLYVFWSGRVIWDDDRFVKEHGLATGVSCALALADADVAIVQGVYCGDLLFRKDTLVDIETWQFFGERGLQSLQKLCELESGVVLACFDVEKDVVLGTKGLAKDANELGQRLSSVEFVDCVKFVSRWGDVVEPKDCVEMRRVGLCLQYCDGVMYGDHGNGARDVDLECFLVVVARATDHVDSAHGGYPVPG